LKDGGQRGVFAGAKQVRRGTFGRSDGDAVITLGWEKKRVNQQKKTGGKCHLYRVGMTLTREWFPKPNIEVKGFHQPHHGQPHTAQKKGG